MAPIHELPDEPALLKRLLIEQQQTMLSQAAQLARQQADQQQAIDAAVAAQLEYAVNTAVDAAVKQAIAETTAALMRRFYGAKNERFDPRQLLLFGLQVDQLPLDEASIAEQAGEPLSTRRAQNRHPHGRGKLPEQLPRIDIIHDLNDAERSCPCCGETRHRIGQEVSEQLEYLPASFKVLRHIRHKYACARCDEAGESAQVVTAAKPPQPIDKGLPGPGLLAYVGVSKLGDHLPLYRLENIFARQQIHVARSTMCAWLAAGAHLFEPLIQLMIERIKRSRVVHTDDTRVPVQSPGQVKCRNGHIWTYLGDADQPYTVYHYTPDRTRAGPAEWLAGYQGYLQADAYGGYDGIYAPGTVREVACWAHARRKFFEAQATDRLRCAQVLLLIRELYAIEARAKELAEAQRLVMRATHSVPVLMRIDAWLNENAAQVLPRSQLGLAMQYARNQWEALGRYATQGFLNIDNNAAERALKRVAIGRKNWLFAGNDKAGRTAAAWYTMIASAERHGLNPQAYLTNVLARIGTTPTEQLDQLLPDVWKRDQVSETNADTPTPT